MAFMDSNYELWDNQALTVTEESRTNGNMFDMEENGAADSQLDRVFWNTLKGTDFTGLASGVTLELLTSDSATFASGVDCIASIGSEDYPLALADINSEDGFSISVPTRTLKMYVEARFHAINEQANAGTLDSWLGMEPLIKRNIQKEPT